MVAYSIWTATVRPHLDFTLLNFIFLIKFGILVLDATTLVSMAPVLVTLTTSVYVTSVGQEMIVTPTVAVITIVLVHMALGSVTRVKT